MKKTIVSIAAASFLMFSPLVTDNIAEASSTVIYTNQVSPLQGTYKVVTQATLRRGASTGYAVTITAPVGATLTATDQITLNNVHWTKVRYNGHHSWTQTSNLTKVEVQQTSNSTALQSYKAQYKFNTTSVIRRGASTSYASVATIASGTIVTTEYKITINGVEWKRVLANGKSGWVEASKLTAYTAPVAKASSSSAMTSLTGTFKTLHNTNLRRGASTGYAVVTTVPAGATVTATDQITINGETWYRVKYGAHHAWLLSSLVTKVTTQQASAPAASGSKVVEVGLSLLGTPYRFGGTTTAGFDCSGFTQYVYKQAGKSITRSTGTQYAESTPTTNPQPGDLVFFANTYKPGISHVGIYIGNKKMVHSGGSKAEIIDLKSNPYWSKHIHSYRSIN